MAAKLCKEQHISISNSTKYSNFIDGKYFLRNYHSKGPYCSIQEQCLFNIMAYGGQLFWGSGCWGVTYTNEIQIQKGDFFFLNPGDGNICN